MPPVTTQHFGTGGKSSSMEEEEVVVVVVVVVVFRLDDKECFGGGMATVSMCDCMTKRSLSLSLVKRRYTYDRENTTRARMWYKKKVQ